MAMVLVGKFLAMGLGFGVEGSSTFCAIGGFWLWWIGFGVEGPSN